MVSNACFLWQNMVEEKEKKIKELQDNIAAINFTPQSKNGKMLMAKCRTLQEENEEIGAMASEGKARTLPEPVFIYLLIAFNLLSIITVHILNLEMWIVLSNLVYLIHVDHIILLTILRINLFNKVPTGRLIIL